MISITPNHFYQTDASDNIEHCNDGAQGKGPWIVGRIHESSFIVYHCATGRRRFAHSLGQGSGFVRTARVCVQGMALEGHPIRSKAWGWLSQNDGSSILRVCQRDGDLSVIFDVVMIYGVD